MYRPDVHDVGFSGKDGPRGEFLPSENTVTVHIPSLIIRVHTLSKVGISNVGIGILRTVCKAKEEVPPFMFCITKQDMKPPLKDVRGLMT